MDFCKICNKSLKNMAVHVKSKAHIEKTQSKNNQGSITEQKSQTTRDLSVGTQNIITKNKYLDDVLETTLFKIKIAKSIEKNNTKPESLLSIALAQTGKNEKKITELHNIHGETLEFIRVVCETYSTVLYVLFDSFGNIIEYLLPQSDKTISPSQILLVKLPNEKYGVLYEPVRDLYSEVKNLAKKGLVEYNKYLPDENDKNNLEKYLKILGMLVIHKKRDEDKNSKSILFEEILKIKDKYCNNEFLEISRCDAYLSYDRKVYDDMNKLNGKELQNITQDDIDLMILLQSKYKCIIKIRDSLVKIKDISQITMDLINNYAGYFVRTQKFTPKFQYEFAKNKTNAQIKMDIWTDDLKEIDDIIEKHFSNEDEKQKEKNIITNIYNDYIPSRYAYNYFAKMCDINGLEEVLEIFDNVGELWLYRNDFANGASEWQHLVSKHIELTNITLDILKYLSNTTKNCHYCKILFDDNYTIDAVDALHGHNKVVICCKSCNSKKSNKVFLKVYDQDEGKTKIYNFLELDKILQE